jgi:hypothetical protein
LSTELDAVNLLLVAKNIVPIIDLDSGHPDVQAARVMLERHSRGVQSQKWWFNVESVDTVTLTEEGWARVPGNVIGLDSAGTLVIMDGKLYDTAERTNIFTEAIEDIKYIYMRDWVNLPQNAFDYIVALAKEEFIRPLRDQLLTRQAERDIVRFLGLLQQQDARMKDTNVQTGNPLFTKWQQKMIQR